MPRNERGQFTRNDIYIPLPSLSGLYKILVIGILIFPWYTILKNKDYSTTLFSSMLGTEYYPTCPVCPMLPAYPACPEFIAPTPPKCPAPPQRICQCPVNPPPKPNSSDSSEKLD